MFYNAFLSIKECYTMHANLLKNVLQCISVYKIMFYIALLYRKQCFTIAFLYTKQCFTMHFYIQNNVIQCISIQKKIFYCGFPFY